MRFIQSSPTRDVLAKIFCISDAITIIFIIPVVDINERNKVMFLCNV